MVKGLTIGRCPKLDRYWLNWLLIVPMAWLAGCAGMLPDTLQPLDTIEERRVLEALRQKEERIQTLRGLFHASVSGTGIPFSQNLLGMFSFAQPDQLTLKSFVRLGVPVMEFHREGNSYELYFPAEGKLISGQMEGKSERTEWDQTVMLSLRALDAVLGKIPGLAEGNVRVREIGNRYRIEMPAGQSSSSPEEEFTIWTWVNARTLEMTSIEYRREFDEIVVSVECEDYRDILSQSLEGHSPFRLPFVVQATDHRPAGGTLTLHFQEFVPNAAS